MSDYISRQTVIDMFQRQAYDDWNQGTGTTWANAFSEAADMIENLPSADAIEVVRCKDCKHYDLFNNGCNGMCLRHIDAFEVFYPDDFCSYGERKDV